MTWFFHVDSYQPPDWWAQVHWYYPGDDYVDWLGISDYGNLLPDQPLRTFTHNLDVVYGDLSSMSQRPLSILEMGAVDNAAHEKPAWITQALGALSQGQYPRVQGVAWWDVGGGTDTTNTTIDSSPDTLQAFRSGIGNAYFGASPVLSGNCAPPTPTSVIARAERLTIHLSWRGSDNATSYEVWRSGRKVAQVAATGYDRTGAYDDRHALRRHKYVYRIRALNLAGQSAFTLAVGAMLP